MRETFLEESAVSRRSASESKMYTLFWVAAIVFFVLTAIGIFFSYRAAVTLLALSADSETGEVYPVARAFGFITYFGVLALVLLAGLACWFLKNRFNVSYDYAFVEDELRVSKVFNGKKRKYLLSMKADFILKIGRCSGESFARTCAGMEKRDIRYLTPNRTPSEGKDLYYILYSSSIEKTVNIIECRTAMLESLVQAAGRNKWEAR